ISLSRKIRTLGAIFTAVRVHGLEQPEAFLIGWSTSSLLTVHAGRHCAERAFFGEYGPPNDLFTEREALLPTGNHLLIERSLLPRADDVLGGGCGGGGENADECQ